MSGERFGLATRAMVVDDCGRSLLVCRSARSKHFPGQWEWPGGKVDPGETAREAVRREVEEECGIKIELTGFLGMALFSLPGVHVVTRCYEARIVESGLALSEEHEGFAWAKPEELGAYDLVPPMRDFMLSHTTTLGMHHG